jgi:hypothetical protein
VSISVVKCSWVKCSEALQCSGVLLCMWLYMVVLYAFVYFCTLYILIVMFMYPYNYACSVLYPN